LKIKSAAKKVYIQPGRLIYDVMQNIMSLQKGVEIFSDEDAGKLQYSITMNDFSWTILFSALEMDFRRCAVTLEIEEEMEPRKMDGEEKDFLDGMVRRQFSLLDSMLLNWGPVRVTYGEGRCI
jgi:hypothetical protein